MENKLLLEGGRAVAATRLLSLRMFLRFRAKVMYKASCHLKGS